MADKRPSFIDLESSILDALNAARLACFVVDDVLQNSRDKDRKFGDMDVLYVHPDFIEMILFTVYQAEQRTKTLSEAFYAYAAQAKGCA